MISFIFITSDYTDQSVMAQRTTIPADVVATPASSDNQAGLFLTYENPTYKIKIQYPSNWQEFKGTNLTSSLTDIISFASPVESTLDYRENLRILIENLSSQNVTLDEFTPDISFLRNASSNNNIIRVINSNTTTLAGHPAQKVVFTVVQDQFEFKDLLVYTIMDHRAYMILYGAAPSKYLTYLPRIQTMINTFEITN